MFKQRLLWIIVLLLVSVLLSVGIDNRLMVLSRTVGVTTNFGRIIAGKTVRVSLGFLDYFKSFRALQQEVSELNQELSQLKEQYKSAEILLAENKKLRELLQFNYSIDYTLLPAHIISSSRGEVNINVVLNKGTLDSVEEGMIVTSIYDQSLVLLGIISRTSRKSSEFTSIQQQGFSIPVVTKVSEQIGILEGQGENSEHMRVLFDSIYNDSVFVGEQVQVQQYSTLFPRGIPVGIISNVITDTEKLSLIAEITPFVKLKNINEVLILVPQQEKE